MLLLVSFTASQVFFRYVLQKPLGWTEELARFTFIWAIFFGATVTARTGKHIRVNLLNDLLNDKVRMFIEIIINIFIITFLGFLIPSSLKYALFAIKFKAVASEIPMFYIYLALPVNGFLMIIYYSIHLIKALSKIAYKPHT